MSRLRIIRVPRLFRAFDIGDALILLGGVVVVTGVALASPWLGIVIGGLILIIFGAALGRGNGTSG